MVKSSTTGRTVGGQFAPGNPGRPRGARHKTTLAVEALLEGEAEALTRKAVSLAKKGDTTALRLCLERLAPVRRGRTMDIPGLPAVQTIADVPGAITFVLASVADGTITSDEANDFTAILDRFSKATEVNDLAERVRAMEEAMRLRNVA